MNKHKKTPELSEEMIETINRLLRAGKRLEIAVRKEAIAIWTIENKRIEV